MTEREERRRKTLALILSGIFPGLGQLYNRRPGKAAVFLAAGVVLCWWIGRVAPGDPAALARPEAELLAPLAALLILSLWSVIDAWRGAGGPR
jgi:hypothetical protein